MKSFRSGDRVTWSSHGGTATGQVVPKITSDTTAALCGPATTTRST